MLKKVMPIAINTAGIIIVTIGYMMEWVIVGKNISKYTGIDIVITGFKFGFISLVAYIFLLLAYFFCFASLSAERKELGSIFTLALGIIGLILMAVNYIFTVNLISSLKADYPEYSSDLKFGIGIGTSLLGAVLQLVSGVMLFIIYKPWVREEKKIEV